MEQKMIIYYLPLTCSDFDELEKKLVCFISPDKQKYIDRTDNNTLKLETLYGELLARMAIAKAGNIPQSLIKFGLGSYGKPKVENFPNIYFNISHTKEGVLAAASTICPIGVDIEFIRNAPLKVMNKAFCEDEILYVNEVFGQDKDARFFEIWTKKEAYTKYTGMGLRSNFSKINTLNDTLSRNYFTDFYGNTVYTIYSEEIANSSIPTDLTVLTPTKIGNFFIA